MYGRHLDYKTIYNFVLHENVLQIMLHPLNYYYLYTHTQQQWWELTPTYIQELRSVAAVSLA